MQAQCLCGAVSISAPDQGSVEACHCGMCRRWGGGAFLSVNCGTDVELAGEDNISVFESSTWAERGFCRVCGSHLFYRMKSAQTYAIPAGLFGNEGGFKLHEQIFIDQKPAYYNFAELTPELTEAQVLERFMQQQSS